MTWLTKKLQIIPWTEKPQHISAHSQGVPFPVALLTVGVDNRLDVIHLEGARLKQPMA